MQLIYLEQTILIKFLGRILDLTSCKIFEGYQVDSDILQI